MSALMALGGSTNAVVHLLAMAGRAGVALTLDDFDAISRQTPLLCNLRPSGKHLMEDFFYAGGLPALLGAMKDRLHLDERTAGGGTWGAALAGAEIHAPDVIRTPAAPVAAEGGLAVLRGNLAPDGAVMKTSAMEARFARHEGPALVFDSYEAMAAAVDDESLAVTAETVLVLRNAGPLGGPGFPEWGMLPIPTKLVKRGVRDMLRISDARMSGTSYGSCVLHVSPEAFVGGPLALVQTGDRVALDLAERRIDVRLEAAELARRQAAWRPPPPRYQRGYGALFGRHITQAHRGCDFDFLEGTAPTDEPAIH
jgi:dihydroxy-acid dehydratase